MSQAQRRMAAESQKSYREFLYKLNEEDADYLYFLHEKNQRREHWS